MSKGGANDVFFSSLEITVINEECEATSIYYKVVPVLN
jgi:hypothetical protein